MCRLQLKCDGTRWCTGGEVKGKVANAVGSQYSSHYLGTRCIQHYYRWCAHLGCQQSDWTDSPADLNGFVHFAERLKSGFCTSAITFQLASKTNFIFLFPRVVDNRFATLNLQSAQYCSVDVYVIMWPWTVLHILIPGDDSLWFGACWDIQFHVINI